MPGSLPSSLIAWGLGAYGKKPKVPALSVIDPSKVQRDTLKGNVANFDDAAALASKTNSFNEQQLSALRELQLPGASSLVQKNIVSQLKGEVSPDVLRQLKRYGAERGGALTAGSQFKLGGDLSQLLGMSMEIQQQGFDSTLKWLDQTKVPTFDFSRSFFSPTDILSFEQNQQTNQFSRNLMANQVKAAPDPWRVGLAQGFDAEINNFNSMMGYAGGSAAGAAGAAAGGGGMSY